MSCRNENRYDDCGYNGYPNAYRNGNRYDDCNYSGCGPQFYPNHHKEAIVDVHVEIPEHCRYY